MFHCAMGLYGRSPARGAKGRRHCTTAVVGPMEWIRTLMARGVAMYTGVDLRRAGGDGDATAGAGARITGIARVQRACG